MAELLHSKHRGVTLTLDVDDLVLTAPAEVVSGGAGFTNASGVVALDLSTGRVFQSTLTGSITSLSFTNIPSQTEYSASWSWVLRVDATGGYTVTGTPTVEWADGSAWDDLNLEANAENILTFWRVGATTYGAFVTTGELALDPYKVCFLADAEVVIMAEDEDIDVANDSQNGDGTITYEKNGTPITARTAFVEGDRLSVICSGMTGTTTVRIPRFI